MRKLIIFLFFLALTILWFWKEVFFNYLFCFSDLTFYFYPYRHFMVESIRQGIIPLWNPFIQLGFPFLATLQPGVFYPLSILYYLLPFDLAFHWFLILHYPLGAFFMYLLCREFKLSPIASFASGLVFAFSGYTLSVLHMPTTLSSVIWLPLVFLFFRRGRPVLTGLFLAVMFLGGEPTIIYGTFWILLIYLLAERFGKWRELGKGLALMLFSFILAGLIDAVQLLPFAELLKHSSRAGGISFAEASYFSFQPRRIIELVFPYFFNVAEFPWVERGWAKFPYLGFIPALLALFYAFLSKDKRVWGIVLLILIILGSYSPLPLYFLLYKFVPGFNLFRYPIKFIFILVFVFSILSGLGMDLLWENLHRMRKVLIVLFLLLFPLALIFFWAYFNQGQVFGVLKPFFAEEIKIGWEQYVRNVSVPRNTANFGILILFLAAAVFWMLAGHFKMLRREVFSAGLVFLVFFDLYTANAGANFSIKSGDYKIMPRNIKILKADKTLFRYFVSPEIYRRSYSEFNYEFYDYRKSVESLRERLSSNQGMLFGLSNVDGYESLRGAEQDKLVRKIWSLNSLEGIRILDMINVKYLVTPWRFNQKGYQLLTYHKEVFKEGGIFLYRNNNWLPRGYFVPRAKVMPNRDQVFEYIFSRNFNPTGEVILEEKVEAPHGFWFTSEWFYPGWKAYVDGKEAKIYRANYMFRAVPLPSPQSKVKYVYDPLSFKLGMVISLVSLLGLLLFSGVVFLRRR